jgi:hypothetical protein
LSTSRTAMLVMVSASRSGLVRLITTEGMEFAGNFLLSQHAEWPSGVCIVKTTSGSRAVFFARGLVFGATLLRWWLCISPTLTFLVKVP